jgi:uncharacterized protein (TIGR03790 family)
MTERAKRRIKLTPPRVFARVSLMFWRRHFCAVFLAAMVLASVGAQAAEAAAPFTTVPATTDAAATSVPVVADTSVPSPARVVVVANSRDPDSEKIARYYMEKRNIPEKNLILLDASTDIKITWTEFVDTIFNPLRARLTKDGWLDAYVTDSRDSEGRLRYVFYGNKIDFLVLCYGMPIQIENDPARLASRPPVPPLDAFKTNQASVDSELSLLAALDTPTAGLVGNPLYKNLTPNAYTRSLVVRIARLDGPGVVAVRGLIDSALAGEANGLQGRAYIDMGGPHPEGEEWLQNASATLRKLGFDVSEDHETSLFTWRQRFDAPAFYFGWYAYDPAGPIADSAFHFPPGAIGIHIHSYSGAMVRDATHRWVGPLVARGIAATVGNVFEPYLDFTHHIDLFMSALAEGRTTGEAAYYSLPALSWQNIFVGDPLYRPFAVSVQQQLDRAASAPGPFSNYVIIRQMNLLQEQGQLDEAQKIGQAWYAQHPDVALAFALAQVDAALNHEADALIQLTNAPASTEVSRGDLGMYAEIARWAAQHHGFPIALDYYAKALAAPSAIPEFTKAMLPEAIDLAKQTNSDDLAKRWQSQLDALNPPAAATAKP